MNVQEIEQALKEVEMLIKVSQGQQEELSDQIEQLRRELGECEDEEYDLRQRQIELLQQIAQERGS